MPEYKIVVTSNIDEEKRKVVKKVLENKQSQVLFLSPNSDKKRKEMLKNADVLLTLNPAYDLSEDEIACLDNVRFMQLFSAGADHIPFQDIPEHITLASNTGAYAEPIAEHVVAMSLALAKRLMEEHKNMIKGEFNQFNGSSKFIKDATIGILGFGGIGKATARLFRAFGSRIFAMNTSGKSDEPTDFIGTTDDLEYILESSDVIVFSMPLTNKTRGLIGKRELEWTKKDAILVNVARGEIINQKALFDHLKANPDFKAGLESWWVEPLRHGKFKLEYPLLDLPNVLASPHNSSVVPGIMKHGIAEASENIKKYLNGEPFKGEINRDDYM